MPGCIRQRTASRQTKPCQYRRLNLSMPENRPQISSSCIPAYHKDKQVQVYLAGKMRGEPEFNFPAFLDAAEKLRDKGFAVHCPAEEELRMGFDPKTGLYPEGMHRT